MKKRSLLLIIFMLTNFIIGFAQRDSVITKSGKIIEETYKISWDLRICYLKNNPNKRIYASEVVKIISEKICYYSVEASFFENTNAYFAKEIFKGPISILELETKVENINVKKYFFMRSGKITPINEKNLNDFYKGYLGDCYQAKDNPKLEYNQNSIVDVLQHYFDCNIPTQKIVMPLKILNPNFGLGIFYGLGAANPVSLKKVLSNGFMKKGDITGSLNNFGINGRIEFLRNNVIDIDISSYKFKFNSSDSIFSFDENYYVSTAIAVGNISMKTISYNISYNHIFKLTNNLDCNLGIGGALGKVKSQTGTATYYVQQFSKPWQVSKTTLIDTEDIKLNTVVAFTCSVGLEYYLKPQLSIYSRFNFSKSTVKAVYLTSKQTDFDILQTSLNVGFRYYLKPKLN